jgi:hypothetical protein
VNSNQPPTSNPTHKTKQTKQNKKQNKTNKQNKQNKQKQNKQKTKQNSDITIKKSLQLNQNSLHHFTSASNKEKYRSGSNQFRNTPLSHIAGPPKKPSNPAHTIKPPSRGRGRPHNRRTKA